MQKQFDLLNLTRRNIFGVSKQFSLEQLNTVPERFNNNIAWNMGHALVSQQLLCYSRTGNDLLIDPELVPRYRRGSKPEEPIVQEELDYIKAKMKETAGQLMEHYQSGHFKDYDTYTTQYRMALNQIEDAIIFNNVHEAMHLHAVLTLARFV